MKLLSACFLAVLLFSTAAYAARAPDIATGSKIFLENTGTSDRSQWFAERLRERLSKDEGGRFNSKPGFPVVDKKETAEYILRFSLVLRKGRGGEHALVDVSLLDSKNTVLWQHNYDCTRAFHEAAQECYQHISDDLKAAQVNSEGKRAGGLGWSYKDASAHLLASPPSSISQSVVTDTHNSFPGETANSARSVTPANVQDYDPAKLLQLTLQAIRDMYQGDCQKLLPANPDYYLGPKSGGSLELCVLKHHPKVFAQEKIGRETLWFESGYVRQIEFELKGGSASFAIQKQYGMPDPPSDTLRGSYRFGVGVYQTGDSTTTLDTRGESQSDSESWRGSGFNIIWSRSQYMTYDDMVHRDNDFLGSIFYKPITFEKVIFLATTSQTSQIFPPYRDKSRDALSSVTNTTVKASATQPGSVQNSPPATTDPAKVFVRKVSEASITPSHGTGTNLTSSHNLPSPPSTTKPAGVLGITGADWNRPGVQGVEIIEVTKGSSAQLAGLHNGDVITSINGINVRSTQQLGRILAQMEPGMKVRISYLYRSDLVWLPQQTVAILSNGD